MLMMMSLNLWCDESSERGDIFADRSGIGVEDPGESDFELHRRVLLEAPTEEILIAEKRERESADIY